MALKGAGDGPLAGLTFGAKDVFHISGTPTGFGHPAWLATHEAPAETAVAVQRLLDAGADLAGKTHTDEMAYSLTGENVHYGTPVNARAPDRIPGGSSNGSAAAVTAGLVDFAIGTDCGGSVRLPASYCGIFGMRPSVDRVPLGGVIPFGPPFDVAGAGSRATPAFWSGWAACSSPMTRSPAATPAASRRRCLRHRGRVGLRRPGRGRRDRGGMHRRRRGRDHGARRAGELFETFRVLQAASIWANHGAWIRGTRPEFGPGIKERFEWAEALDARDVDSAKKRYQSIQAHIAQVMGEGDILCLPTSPRVAPPRIRRWTTSRSATATKPCTCCASPASAGFPRSACRWPSSEGLPLGLSLNGPRGADMQLLGLARKLTPGGPV